MKDSELEELLADLESDRGERKAFFRDADRALYQAKDAGKNCVVVDDESQKAARARGLLRDDR